MALQRLQRQYFCICSRLADNMFMPVLLNKQGTFVGNGRMRTRPPY
ncbi:MAG: hypothetical protein ACTSWY_00800 [Promethearchaeota archaeon]